MSSGYTQYEAIQQAATSNPTIFYRGIDYDNQTVDLFSAAYRNIQI